VVHQRLRVRLFRRGFERRTQERLHGGLVAGPPRHVGAGVCHAAGNRSITPGSTFGCRRASDPTVTACAAPSSSRKREFSPAAYPRRFREGVRDLTVFIVDAKGNVRHRGPPDAATIVPIVDALR
jgi:hypothetical protein